MELNGTAEEWWAILEAEILHANPDISNEQLDCIEKEFYKSFGDSFAQGYFEGYNFQCSLAQSYPEKRHTIKERILQWAAVLVLASLGVLTLETGNLPGYQSLLGIFLLLLAGQATVKRLPLPIFQNKK